MLTTRKKLFLIFGKGPTQALEHKPTAGKMYSIVFIEHNKKFCLSLHYHGANSALFVNSKEIHKFKAKDFEIVAIPLCLGNISKDWLDVFMILVLIIVILLLMVYWTFTII